MDISNIKIGTCKVREIVPIQDKKKKLEGYSLYDSTGHLMYFYKESVADCLQKFFDRHAKAPSDLNESNFSRMLTHIDNGYCFISASRNENTDQENAEATDRLAYDIRSLGMGYIPILGGFIENKGMEDETEVTERSFIVPQPKDISDIEFFDAMIELCRKYNQDSVLLSMPGFCDFGYYDKNGNLDFSPGENLILTDEKVGEYFSALHKGSRRNKKFAFTEWLAVRRAGNVTDSVYLRMNGENIHLQ